MKFDVDLFPLKQSEINEILPRFAFVQAGDSCLLAEIYNSFCSAHFLVIQIELRGKRQFNFDS